VEEEAWRKINYHIFCHNRNIGSVENKLTYFSRVYDTFLCHKVQWPSSSTKGSLPQNKMGQMFQ